MKASRGSGVSPDLGSGGGLPAPSREVWRPAIPQVDRHQSFGKRLSGTSELLIPPHLRSGGTPDPT